MPLSPQHVEAGTLLAPALVGLDPEDLRNPPGNVLHLIARSRILGPLANRLQDTADSV